MLIRSFVTVFILTACLTSSPAFAEPTPATADPSQAIAALTRENTLLQEKIKAFEGGGIITSAELAARNTKRLAEVAAEVRAQRQWLAEFETYVKWMSGHVAGYNKYFAAGSVAARIAKVLPVPYAGQASLITKFVSDAGVSLGASSVCINKYLATSQQFIAKVDALQEKGGTPRDVSAVVRFADQELLKEMTDVQERLVSTAQLASSSLAFLESVNHYVGSSDEMWTKTKSFLSSDDKKEKSFLAESIGSLRSKVQGFNGKYAQFDASVRKTAPQIKSLVAYDDLIREMEPKVAKLK